MQTKRYLVSATVLLASLLLFSGCSKKPEQTASAMSVDNQNSAIRPGSADATSGGSVANTAPASSASAPAANSTAGAAQQVYSQTLVIPAGTASAGCVSG